MAEIPEKFDAWCVVELFGHQRIAGRVSEQTIGGATFVRVDVPETPESVAYTKLYGAGAIYAITATTEAIARLNARQLERYRQPVPYAPAQPRQLAAGGAAAEESEADWRPAEGEDLDDEETDDGRPF